MIIYNANGTPLINVEVDDTSYRYRAIMQADELNLEFSLAEHYELPVGAYCTFEAQRYVLMELSDVTVHHRRNYEYVVRMYGPLSETANYIIHNPVDNRIKFDLTARPEEHLALIVANLNERDGAGTWSVGSYISSTEKTISYNSTNCRDALSALAQTFETEFEVVSYTINLRKVEYHKDTPLSLSYGKGNGLRPGVKRISSSMPVGKIYVQGGSRNISLSEYGASTLHLPQNVSFRFDGTDFVNSGGVQMHTDSQGYYAYIDGAASNATELALDLSNIYPKRVGTVSGLRFEYNKGYFTYAQLIAQYPSLTDDDWDSVQVDFFDSTIPATLDYSECQMTNDEPLTVIFQSGNLSGREFQVNFKKEATEDEQARPANRFEMIKTDIDGVNMPTRNFLPADGDTYAVFNVNLPSEYINNASDKTGAEWDALKEAARVLYENKDPKVAYRGDLDPLFAKADWVNVGDYLKCGSYISFSDPAVQTTPIAVRIVGVRQYVNNKECPTIEFSNDIVAPTLSSTIKSLATESAHVEELNKQTQRYAQRSFRNAKETMGMLIDAKLKGYTEAISPIAVQTMQMLVGDESLQFKFWQNAACTVPINPVQPFDMATKTVTISHAYLQHMTLGIDSIMPAQGRQLSDYKIWEMQEHTSAVLSDPDARYYVYAKCEKNDTSALGHYVFDTESHDMEETEDGTAYYYLLIGILNSEMDGDRDFASLYGFTEILPGQITTDKIRSSNGYSWFDMNLNQMRFGDANKSFSWNLNNNSEFLVEGGTINVKSRGNNGTSMITCDRGAFDPLATYYYGDEIYTSDGARYIYINSTPSSVAPPNATYWQLKQAAGSTAKLVSIAASSLVFTYESSSSSTPTGDTSITLTCLTQNILSPTYKWFYKNNSNIWTQISGETSSTLSVAYNSSAFLGGKVADIKVIVNDDTNLYDVVSLYKVYGGTDAISAFLTNTSHLFAAGTTSAAAGSDTYEVIVFRGATKLTCGANDGFTINESGITISPITVVPYPTTDWMMRVVANKTGNVQNGTITVTVTQNLNVPSGTVTIPIVVGSETFNLVYSWALSLTGAKGSAGARLRGPTVWNSTSFYESGENSDFQDIVYYVDNNGDAQYYLCVEDVEAGTESNPNPNPKTDTDHWQKGSHFDFVASDISVSLRSKIVDLTVNKLTTENPNDQYAVIKIAENQINIANSAGVDKVKITSGNLPSGGEESGEYSLSSSTQTIAPLVADASGTIEVNVGSIAIDHENNRVAIPTLSFTLTYTSTSVTGGINATCSLWAGGTCLATHPLSAGTGHTTHSANDLARTISLPVTPSGSPHIIKLIIDYTATGESAVAGSLAFTRGNTSRTITYPAEFTMIATDGAQFRYGTEGFKTTSGGAKVIQSGTAYNMAGIGALNGLTAPKRIVFCTTYPDPMSSDVFYIKVQQSS